MGRHTLRQLRQTDPGLDHLPDRIEIPLRRIGALEAMPVAETTIDDLAFAIGEWRSRLIQMQAAVSALERLYHLAREAGCVGSDSAVAAVLNGRTR